MANQHLGGTRQEIKPEQRKTESPAAAAKGKTGGKTGQSASPQPSRAR